MMYNAMVELACVGLAAPLSAHVLHTSLEKLFCNRQSGEGRLGGGRAVSGGGLIHVPSFHTSAFYTASQPPY